MEATLLNALDSLKAALDQDPRVRALAESEDQMSRSPEVRRLAERKDAAQTAYEDVVARFGVRAAATLAAQKALYEAKKALDEEPLVQRYNAAYSEVRDLYMAIDDTLFGPYRRKQLLRESR